MQFYSDNCAPVHPKVMAAIEDANRGYVKSYGEDELTQKAEARVREVFEAPDAVVRLVGTGSAANSLILSTLCQPWHAIYCGALAHINTDECNAVEFYSGGAKLCTLPSPDGKVTPGALEAAIKVQGAGDVHRPQPGALSITQVTECGTIYTVDEIRALTDIAHAHGLRTHMDGARFANAVAALGCSPAEMSWRAGIDAVSFGGTKNGMMGVEACVVFDASHDWELSLRRKRATQLFSKQRFLAAQIIAALSDDLWLEMARSANTAGQGLADGLRAIDGVRFDYKSEANMLFVRLPDAVHDRLADANLLPLRNESDMQVRLVSDWSVSAEDVARLLEVARGA